MNDQGAPLRVRPGNGQSARVDLIEIGSLDDHRCTRRDEDCLGGADAGRPEAADDRSRPQVFGTRPRKRDRIDCHLGRVRQAVEGDEPDRVRLTADVEGRAGEDQDAMHVIGIAGIDVIEIGGMLVLVPVDDHADAASAQESANLFEVRHIREGLQFLA